MQIDAFTWWYSKYILDKLKNNYYLYTYLWVRPLSRSLFWVFNRFAILLNTETGAAEFFLKSTPSFDAYLSLKTLVKLVNVSPVLLWDLRGGFWQTAFSALKTGLRDDNVTKLICQFIFNFCLDRHTFRNSLATLLM